jgi:uncharacterized protein (TIGR02246 family)
MVNPDEAAIIEVHERFAVAWSTGDIDTLVELFAEDSVRVGVAGDTQRGRDEIRAAMERVLTRVFPGATITIPPGDVRLLADDVAIWRGALAIHPAGAPAPLHGYAVDVMKRIGGRWLIVETHPKLFPPAR